VLVPAVYKILEFLAYPTNHEPSVVTFVEIELVASVIGVAPSSA
jgi:hypothetical protein